ncbi:MAG: 50S ribosomal protein L11 methyltransferase, partial [Gemmatimonadota bacterium]|nr:50S ribosomal protein L11 methyltransferase [Gemmatimonadota bacterium]
PPDARPDDFIAALRSADEDLIGEHAPLPDVDWSLKWRERIGAHTLGRLTVTPPWLADGCDPATTVIIEPAMAFGTGEHPTTRGVVRLMQGVVRAGDAVADLGAGSAILAIAAVKLGAGRAFAIENDHDSIANAEENVTRRCCSRSSRRCSSCWRTSSRRCCSHCCRRSAARSRRAARRS